MTHADSFGPEGDLDPTDPAFRERLTAYLDGELSPEESRQILAWLEKNPNALKELEEHRRVWALLSKYRDEPVPQGFAERVLSTTGAASAGGPARRLGEPEGALRVLRGGRALRFAAVAATVVLAFGVGVFAMRRQSPTPAGAASPLDAVPAALLESEAVVNLATVSDEEFETILQGDPEDLVQVVAGRGGRRVMKPDSVPFRASRRFLAVAVVWAAAIVGAGSAWADDPPAAGSAVARLSADESALLARRFADWERRPEVERERIATNVIRLRSLSGEQRAKFFERLRRVEAAGPAVMAELPDRLATYGRLRPSEQQRVKEGGRAERAILGAVRAALSPQANAAIEGREGLPPAERMLLSSGMLAHWRQQTAQASQTGPAPEHVPGLSDEDETRYQRLREKIARGEALLPRDRMWFGAILLKERVRQAASTVPPPTPDMRPDARIAHERALVRAMGDAFPEAVKAVAAEVEAAAAKGRDGLYEYAKAHAPPPPRAPTLFSALTALERSRELLTDEGRAKVDEAQVALLVALKVSDEEVARFKAAAGPRERALFLWELQQRFPSRKPPK